MELSSGHILNGRYRIVKALGSGGMGKIYRAWDLTLNIPVAIKENLEATPEAKNQFIKEAHILATLSHPNLPRVTDYFLVEGQAQYLVMDFVDGEDLQSYLSRQQMPPEQQIIAWIIQICGALEYLHSQTPPVIHRDIKPANIKIRPDGRVVLVDFGIAKLYHSGQGTTLGAKAVTPGFSPIEQYGFGSTDARSDIYSLGATLYALLTGETPPESTSRASRKDPLILPQVKNSALSPFVCSSILKAMALNADERYQSIGEMAKALCQTTETVHVVDKHNADPYSDTNTIRGGKKISPLIQSGIIGGVVAIVVLVIAAAILVPWVISMLRPAATIFPSVKESATPQAAIVITATSNPLIVVQDTPTLQPTETLPPTITPIPPLEKNIKVYADKEWQSTGINISDGQEIAIKYISGKWSPWGGGECGAEGMPDTDPVINNVVTGVLHASLVARVGTGKPFYVGTYYSHSYGWSGTLYLRINDTQVQDNSGFITVNIILRTP